MHSAIVGAWPFVQILAALALLIGTYFLNRRVPLPKGMLIAAFLLAALGVLRDMAAWLRHGFEFSDIAVVLATATSPFIAFWFLVGQFRLVIWWFGRTLDRDRRAGRFINPRREQWLETLRDYDRNLLAPRRTETREPGHNS